MAKMRSPNFPLIALPQAIDLVGKIFREDRTNAIDKDVAAKHMGYTGLTGRTLKLLGALSQFGLVEKVARGQVRVSPTAVSILHWSDEGERREAIAKAGTSPALFRRIRSSFDEPSERTLSSFLIKEGFTDSAIPSVLRSYRETNRFLAEAGVSESYGRTGTPQKDDPTEFDELENDEGEMLVTPPPPATSAPARPSVPLASPSPESHTGLSINFDMRSVAVSGRTTSPDDLREFIGALSTLADVFEKLTARTEAA